MLGIVAHTFNQALRLAGLCEASLVYIVPGYPALHCETNVPPLPPHPQSIFIELIKKKRHYKKFKKINLVNYRACVCVIIFFKCIIIELIDDRLNPLTS